MEGLLMAAYFFNDGERTYIISNTMSVVNAGFRVHAEYYNKDGNTLTYYMHPCGTVLARISMRRRQPVQKFFKTTAEANKDFKCMNHGLTFQTGMWVKKRNCNMGR
jgi:hypothetical protein